MKLPSLKMSKVNITILISNLDYYWVQEEPENQGAYTFMAPRLERLINGKLNYHGRKPSAAPATGIATVYKKEQKHVISGIFADLK
jgi:probable 2-oxoglutarate dehydrogenase E1 component DHKTD1